MTLVLGAHSRDTLWVLADRRLSYGDTRPPRDDGVKIVSLQTEDGVGLLAYAGLGATSRGMQPSDWMSSVLRGRRGLAFEQALSIVARLATSELPRHLEGLDGGAHFIVVPAFIRAVGPRLYSIYNVLDKQSGRHWYRYTSHQRTDLPGSPGVRLVLAGTGGRYLHQHGGGWQRPFLSLLKAHDHGRVSDHAVADYLARLNYQVHRQLSNGTVGPTCVVVWRRRLDPTHITAGSGRQFYIGVDRDSRTSALPAIANGHDVRAIGTAVLEALAPQLRARLDAPSDVSNPGETWSVDFTELNRLLGKLPESPDEKLR